MRYLILACTTFCYQPHFKVDTCTIDKADKEPYTYRRIVSIDETDYTYQIANRQSDLMRHLFSSGDIEVYDKQNTEVACPSWF